MKIMRRKLQEHESILSVSGTGRGDWQSTGVENSRSIYIREFIVKNPNANDERT